MADLTNDPKQQGNSLTFSPSSPPGGGGPPGGAPPDLSKESFNPHPELVEEGRKQQSQMARDIMQGSGSGSHDPGKSHEPGKDPESPHR
jgi:hypothetical protein